MAVTPNYLKSLVEKLLQAKVDSALEQSARELYGGRDVDIALESEEETKWVQANYKSFDTQVCRRYCCSSNMLPCNNEYCRHPTSFQSSWIVRMKM
jgi:hypothetical protein